MSSDKDFFRYEDHGYMVYHKFTIERGKLCLEPHPGPREDPDDRPSPRPLLLNPLPETLDKDPSTLLLRTVSEYYRC